MNDRDVIRAPAVLDAIRRDAERVGFTLASEPQTGSLLRGLAASKPGGLMLELGTGTGVGTTWLLSGMDATSRLVTVDSDPTVVEIARRHLGHDSRVTFHLGDGGEFLEQSSQQFDLIFADAWPGKFTHLDRALSLLRVGGVYVVDDLLPQPSWPDGHAPNVQALIPDLEHRPGFIVTKLAWSSGLMMLVRTHATPRRESKNMSTNAERARRWFKEVWVPGGEATVQELMADHLDGHMEGVDVQTREQFLAERHRLLDAFPDLAIVVDDVIADGAKVVVRWHVTATHKGNSLGFAATNRRVSFRGMTWLEFDNGRIVRGWDSWNLGALIESLTSPQQ